MSGLSRRSVRRPQEDAAKRATLANALSNDLVLEEIATGFALVLTGWVRYFGRFYPSKLREELRTIDAFIVRWAARKYKRFQGHAMATWDWLRTRLNVATRTYLPIGPGTNGRMTGAG